MAKAITLKDLFENKLHIGHRTDRWNPKMKPFIFEKKEGIHVFDLQKTLEGLEKAKQFLTATKIKNAKVLFVGTKPQTAHVIRDLLVGGKHAYIDEKWSPGLLTNFKDIRKRIDHYVNLKAQFESGEIKKYTKKEVAGFKKDLDKLEKAYRGVAEMRERPDVIVVLDAIGNKLAIKEAQTLKTPLVAIVDTNANPDGIAYPIPANDDSVKSIGFIVKSMLESLE